MRPSFIVAALLVAALIIAVLQWRSGSSGTDESPAPGAQDSAAESVAPEIAEPVLEPVPPDTPEPEPLRPTPVTEAPPAVVLPELAASDDFVLAEVDSWQLPEAWLRRSDLLSRASVVLMNAASGRIPSRQVSFLVPVDSYPVQQAGEQYFVDPNGYGRYDPYIAILEGIDPAELAAFLRLVDPLLVQALAQLGVRERPQALLADAIGRVERIAGLPPGPVELLRPSVMYTYADPELEALPDLDKQLLRMGHQNISRIKSYLSDFKKNYFRN